MPSKPKSKPKTKSQPDDEETVHLITISDETLQRMFAMGWAEPKIQWTLTEKGNTEMRKTLELMREHWPK